jgi:hypothetical protein
MGYPRSSGWWVEVRWDQSYWYARGEYREILQGFDFWAIFFTHNEASRKWVIVQNEGRQVRCVGCKRADHSTCRDERPLDPHAFLVDIRSEDVELHTLERILGDGGGVEESDEWCKVGRLDEILQGDFEVYGRGVGQSSS